MSNKVIHAQVWVQGQAQEQDSKCRLSHSKSKIEFFIFNGSIADAASTIAVVDINQ